MEKDKVLVFIFIHLLFTSKVDMELPFYCFCGCKTTGSKRLAAVKWWGNETFLFLAKGAYQYIISVYITFIGLYFASISG